MTKYREANVANLAVGVALILFGAAGLTSLAMSNSFSSNLFWPTIFILAFVLVGSYETGKYAEMRNEKRVTSDLTVT